MINWDEYTKLADPEKRVMIANDIIQAIMARKLVASYRYIDVLTEDSTNIPDNIGICASCAVGAAVIARCEYRPECVISKEFYCWDTMAEAGFTLAQARKMEQRFENDLNSHDETSRNNLLLKVWQEIANAPDGLPDYLKGID